MKRLIGCLLIVCLCFLPCAVSASTTGWWFVHGNAGSVETSANVFENHLRDGTDITMNAGQTDARVYIPIPIRSVGTERINSIFVAFFTSPNVRVHTIEVWDGNGNTLQSFTGSWTGTQALTFPFPRTQFPHGICIRLRIANDGAGAGALRLTSAGIKVVKTT